MVPLFSSAMLEAGKVSDEFHIRVKQVAAAFEASKGLTSNHASLVDLPICQDWASP